jgi:outer membrane lipoprotein-sorting protein
MRAGLTGWLLVALVLGGAGTARAQTVDDVVNKVVAALGGREALNKITSRSTSGKISVSTAAGEIPGTVEVSNQAPNKIRTLISLDLSSLGAGALTLDRRFDGSAGYVMDSMQGNRDITGDELANMKNADFPTPLLRYKERGMKIELGPKEKVGEHDTQVLLIAPQAGPPSKLYVDTQTWLPARVVQTLELPEVGRIEQTTDLSDYRVVDGVKVPFAIHTVSTAQTISISLDKVEHNVKIDTALFGKPGGGL